MCGDLLFLFEMYASVMTLMILTSSLLSLCDVISAFMIGIPSKSHDIFAVHVWINETIRKQKTQSTKNSINALTHNKENGYSVNFTSNWNSDLEKNKQPKHTHTHKTKTQYALFETRNYLSCTSTQLL